MIGSILVNPWDIEALSESFFKALTLPKPVIKRNMDMMSKYVFSNTANQWGESFLRKVEGIKEEDEREDKNEISSFNLGSASPSKLDVVIISQKVVRKMGDLIQVIESEPLQNNTVFLTSLKDTKLPTPKHSRLLAFNPSLIDTEEIMKPVTRIVEYFAERTPGSIISRKAVLKSHLIEIGSSEMVHWHCRFRIWCLATDANIPQFKKHTHRSQSKSMSHFL